MRRSQISEELIIVVPHARQVPISAVDLRERLGKLDSGIRCVPLDGSGILGSRYGNDLP